MNLDPTILGYSQTQARRFFEQVATEARQVLGVTDASLTRYMPMDGGPPSVTFVPEGVSLPPGKESVSHAASSVDERFLDTIGLPIVAGRGFAETDTEDAPPVVIVNSVLAERYWPGQSPLGKRLGLAEGGRPAEIVGIAQTSKYGFATEPPMPFLYLPFRQRPAQNMFLLVQYRDDLSHVTSRLREMVRRLDPNMPVTNVRTMEELYRMRSLDVLGVVTTIIGVMGIMGLALAVVGLYGLVAYSVNRRTKEIGIRMAIGAGRSDVLRLVIGEGMALAAIGLAVGMVGSAGAARALASTFPGGPHGDGSTDVAAFLIVGATVSLVTILATYLPARRAARIDPTLALRCD
jgi:predicted permease